MTVLETKDLTKKYGRIVALDQLNLKIESGNVYGLLGPNGSGKTTTLGIILSILKQDSGTYEWFGGIDAIQARLRIGAILETPNFYPYHNAIENLRIISLIKKVPSKNFDYLLERVGLYDRRHSAFRTYSLGMKQRLAIAATLIGDPEILIFDEPTNGLDPQGISEVREILKEIASGGKTVLMASHILDEVEKICSHVAIIKKGVLLASGPVGTILSNDSIIEIMAGDKSKLIEYLSREFSFTLTADRVEYIEGQIPGHFKAEDIALTLSKFDMVPTRLVLRKRRLEEDFLAITKD